MCADIRICVYTCMCVCACNCHVRVFTRDKNQAMPSVSQHYRNRAWIANCCAVTPVKATQARPPRPAEYDKRGPIAENRASFNSPLRPPAPLIVTIGTRSPSWDPTATHYPPIVGEAVNICHIGRYRWPHLSLYNAGQAC